MRDGVTNKSPYKRRSWESLSPICLQLSIGGGRLQKSNQLGAVLGRREPTVRLHVVARHDLIGFRDAVELSRATPIDTRYASSLTICR
jgi:hypothetical protein